MLSFENILQQIEDAVRKLEFDCPPASLYEPVKYILSLGGKRIRPALVLIAYTMYKDNATSALNTALGWEVFHNFTLLHDDLMDKADMRRNKPTVHKVWNENTAILSGDTMLVLAYQQMCRIDNPVLLKKVLDIFTEMALEIGEGQQYDMEFETRDDVTEEEYIEMIRLKTSVLLASALKIGALLGGASDKEACLLYDYGVQVGLAFQLQDDYLDVYGDPALFGKKIGGDILCNKKTYMLINALLLADDGQRVELKRWIDAKEYESQEKIQAVTALYDQIGIRELCDKKITAYFEKAGECLNALEVDDCRKQMLREFIGSLIHRNV